MNRIAALLFALAVPASDQTALDLARRLDTLRSPGPLAASVRLELRLERTVHHQTMKGEASAHLDVDRDEGGLRVRWEPALLAQADAEEGERDRTPDRLTPVRDVLKELDPARLGHLLDQSRTLAGLTKGTPVEDSNQVYEGQEARRLVYRFQPRLSWADSEHLGHSEGRFTVWVAADGTPLASESIATFEGKTSRLFGRYQGTTTIRTRYAIDGGRLWVADRTEDDAHSHEDGSEVEHTWKHYTLEHR